MLEDVGLEPGDRLVELFDHLDVGVQHHLHASVLEG
jgi:hypothetical protein